MATTPHLAAKHQAVDISACHHEGPCTMDNCSCMQVLRRCACWCFLYGSVTPNVCLPQRNNFCEKFCACDESCGDRYPGCRCTDGCKATTCLCKTMFRECDPDVCNSCKHDADCVNQVLLRGHFHHVRVGLSDLHG